VTARKERGPLILDGPLIWLTESAIRGRVIMIHRMKRNLICEWHPILDILLGDYERELKRVEALREPPEPVNSDDPDAQDRDFDDEAKVE